MIQKNYWNELSPRAAPFVTEDGFSKPSDGEQFGLGDLETPGTLRTVAEREISEMEKDWEPKKE